NLGRGVAGRADPIERRGLIARERLGHGRQVRQRVGAGQARPGSPRHGPALTYSIEEPSEGNSTSIWPAIRSVSAGALPRYGTWTRVTPAIILNSSPARWT